MYPARMHISAKALNNEVFIAAISVSDISDRNFGPEWAQPMDLQISSYKTLTSIAIWHLKTDTLLNRIDMTPDPERWSPVFHAQDTHWSPIRHSQGVEEEDDRRYCLLHVNNPPDGVWKIPVPMSLDISIHPSRPSFLIQMTAHGHSTMQIIHAVEFPAAHEPCAPSIINY